MTNDEIINIARAAGWPHGHLVFAELKRLTEFANLVAAAEREACVRLAEETKAPFTADLIRARKDKQ